MSMRTAINILVVLVLAAIVAVVPGGGTAAGVVTQAVSLAFLGALASFAAMMYRQHRLSLYAIGDHRRAALYAAIGVAAIVLTATNRMWSTSLGSVLWLVLLGVAIYVAAAVFIAARR